MSKSSTFFILIITSIIFLTIPFISKKEVNENLALGINFISSFSSLLTLGIALVLYNKFGIESTLLEKQTTEVFKLLEDLNNTKLMISGENLFTGFNPVKPYNNSLENYYHEKVIFSSRYILELDNIWRYSGNIFLPPEIATKIKNVHLRVIITNSNIKYDGLKIVPLGTENNENEVFGNPNNKEQTLMEFLDNWNELVDEIKGWIKKNSSINSKLNL